MAGKATVHQVKPPKVGSEGLPMGVGPDGFHTPFTTQRSPQPGDQYGNHGVLL